VEMRQLSLQASIGHIPSDPHVSSSSAIKESRDGYGRYKAMISPVSHIPIFPPLPFFINFLHQIYYFSYLKIVISILLDL
jgi:hypothetical protein